MSSSITAIREQTLAALACATVVAAALTTGCSSSSNSGFVGSPTNLTIAAGDALNETVGADVGPFVVKVTDTAGTGIQGVVINYTASAGLTLRSATATTGSDGTAFTSGTFGNVSGPNTVTASVAGISTPVVFHITANPEQATVFIANTGNNQTAAAGTLLSEPVSVKVTDRFDNPVSGVNVSWTSPRGTIGTMQSHTSSTGVASTTFTLPPQTGATLLTATANINGVPLTVVFTETGT